MSASTPVAIVTGGGSGFGAGIARALAADGTVVVIAEIAEAAGQAIAEEISQLGGKAVCIQGDVTSRASWDNLLKQTVERFGQINYIVNNAGGTYRSKPVLQTTQEDFDKVINLNILSIFHSVHASVPYLKESSKKGLPAAIVNVASTAGIVGRPGLTWYCAAKAAAISITKTLAIEFGADQIRVNAVCPVMGMTGMTDLFLGDVNTPEQVIKSIPLGRMCTTEDMGNSVAWLCSDKAKFITGVALPVDGGRCA